MSIHQTQHVWTDPTIERHEIITLLAIADQANDAGIAWIGQTRLAKRTRQSDRNLRRDLEKATQPRGLISPPLIILPNGGKSRTNLYILTPTMGAVCADCISERDAFIKDDPPDFITTEAYLKIADIFHTIMNKSLTPT